MREGLRLRICRASSSRRLSCHTTGDRMKSSQFCKCFHAPREHTVSITGRNWTDSWLGSPTRRNSRSSASPCPSSQSSVATSSGQNPRIRTQGCSGICFHTRLKCSRARETLCAESAWTSATVCTRFAHRASTGTTKGASGELLQTAHNDRST